MIEPRSRPVIHRHNPSDVYCAISTHQREHEWDHRAKASYLQLWMERFDVHFKMHLPSLVLSVEPLPSKVFGQFRRGHNGFGLQGEIAVNSRHLSDGQRSAPVLGLLLHEMLHSWQFFHGHPSARITHNKEFRSKARELGLLVTASGEQGYAEVSPFKDLLRRFGMQLIEELKMPVPQEQRGDSVLKKWSCGCTNVRVAVADFQAKCLKCNRLFVRQ